MKSILFILIPFLVSQTFASRDATGYGFLKIPMGPKSVSLGKAFVSLANDPSATFWNPAGLGFMTRKQFQISHAKSVDDMFNDFGAVVIPTNYGSVGVNFLYSSSGTIPTYSDSGRSGEISAYDTYATVSYSMRVSQKFSYGISARVFCEKIDSYSGYGGTLDLGMLVHNLVFDGLNMGLSLKDWGPDAEFNETRITLPLRAQGGLSYVHRYFTAVAELNLEKQRCPTGHFGMEIPIANILFLRGGYSTNKWFDFGGGFIFKMITVDGAFSPSSDLGLLFSLAATVTLSK